MAISNATRLADFGTGIGTAGAVLKVDNDTDRVGIGTTDPRGTLQVGIGITMGPTGIMTAQTIEATTSVVGGAVTSTSGGINVTGVVTATSFSGDGSSLTGVSGFSTALASSGVGQQLFKTDEVLTIGAGTSYKVESDDASGNVVFTRVGRLDLGTGATFVVGTGCTFVMDVLNVFS
tara:strand:- start:1080 stop:1610 length:531 start_codon:yes stop_codon:yes gene_type:complete